MPQIFDIFLPADSSVTLELAERDNDQVQDGLLNSAFDVILFVAEDARPKVGFEILITAPPYCPLPAPRPLNQQSSVSLAQIAQDPLVVLNWPVAASYCEGLFQADARQTPAAAYVNSTEIVRSIVASVRARDILNMRPLITNSHSGAKAEALPISDDLPLLRVILVLRIEWVPYPPASRPIDVNQSRTLRAFWRVEICKRSWKRPGNRCSEPTMRSSFIHVSTEARVRSDLKADKFLRFAL